MTTTSFEDRCSILAELWMNYRNDQNFTDFISYNDLGLPLAYLLDNEIVKSTALSVKFINETFDLLLGSLELKDNGYVTLDDVFLDNQGQFGYNYSMENKVEIVFTREQVAKATMLDLTDKQWIYLAGELENGFDFYFEDQCRLLSQDLDYLMAIDKKFDENQSL